MAVPNKVVPLKNSTLAMVPSVSAALADMVKFAGADKVVPVAGAIMFTVGAISTGAFTLTEKVAEVAVRPLLSVALAIKA